MTAAQKREAEIALYGVGGGDNMPQQKNEHELPTAPPVGTMDLNNPPRMPYHFEPFPATLYKGRENRIVQNEAEQKDWMSKGWKKQPEPEGVEAEEHEAEPKPAEKKK
jgi:hypothetical protein